MGRKKGKKGREGNLKFYGGVWRETDGTKLVLVMKVGSQPCEITTRLDSWVYEAGKEGI